MIITARKRSLGQGNIFTPVCHSVHRGGMRGCSWGGMVARGACMVALGGHAWFYSGGHAWFYSGGACMVLFGPGHAWFFQFFQIQ